MKASRVVQLARYAGPKAARVVRSATGTRWYGRARRRGDAGTRQAMAQVTMQGRQCQRYGLEESPRRKPTDLKGSVGDVDV